MQKNSREMNIILVPYITAHYRKRPTALLYCAQESIIEVIYGQNLSGEQPYLKLKVGTTVGVTVRKDVPLIVQPMDVRNFLQAEARSLDSFLDTQYENKRRITDEYWFMSQVITPFGNLLRVF